MFMEERQKDIVRKINETGRILVTEIQEFYQVSADCARRDLKNGGIFRTHWLKNGREGLIWEVIL